MTATLYVTQGSGNSIKPLMAARRSGAQCAVRYMDVLAGATREPEYLAINPQGVVPYLQFDDGSGLGESNAIAWYLAEGSDLIPGSALGRAQAIRWMNFEQTALEANISPVRFFTHIAPQLASDDQLAMVPVWREQGNKGLTILDAYLAHNDFVTCDGYSVADIAVYGYTHLAGEGGFDLNEYTAISAWIERVAGQADYQPIDVLLDGLDRDTLEKAA